MSGESEGRAEELERQVARPSPIPGSVQGIEDHFRVFDAQDVAIFAAVLAEMGPGPWWLPSCAYLFEHLGPEDAERLGDTEVQVISGITFEAEVPSPASILFEALGEVGDPNRITFTVPRVLYRNLARARETGGLCWLYCGTPPPAPTAADPDEPPPMVVG